MFVAFDSIMMLHWTTSIVLPWYSYAELALLSLASFYLLYDLAYDLIKTYSPSQVQKTWKHAQVVFLGAVPRIPLPFLWKTFAYIQRY